MDPWSQTCPFFRAVGTRESAIIDFTEAAYDLESEHDEWVRRLLAAGMPAFDQGLGMLALTAVRPPEPGPIRIARVHAIAGEDALAERVQELEQKIDMRSLWPLGRPGAPKTLSEVAHDHDPTAFASIMRHFDFAEDALGLSAFDSTGWGVYLITPLPKVTTLSARARERWGMLTAHLRAAHRLRRAIENQGLRRAAKTGLPLDAEAVIDASDFRIAEAAGRATSRPALAALRDAAEQKDRARGHLRDSDPEKALELWRALVRGRWSTVDWFDSGGRRYVLGIPNPPEMLDPRGLTEREQQVVSHAVLGMTNKMIGYTLGVSPGRVSTLLGSAMKKLGVHTRAQLIKRMTDFDPMVPR